MRGLVLRLAGLNAGAESAMRLIGFFDTLVEQRLGLDGVLVMAARVAECPVGLAGPGPDGLAARPDGSTRPGGPPRARPSGNCGAGSGPGWRERVPRSPSTNCSWSVWRWPATPC